MRQSASEKNAGYRVSALLHVQCRLEKHASYPASWESLPVEPSKYMYVTICLVQASAPKPGYAYVLLSNVFLPPRFPTFDCLIRALMCVEHRPIAVVQSNNPSDEYVDALHAELLRRVEELYYKHRPDWETRTLVIT